MAAHGEFAARVTNRLPLPWQRYGRILKKGQTSQPME
jgi:hypothetical protein